MLSKNAHMSIARAWAYKQNYAFRYQVRLGRYHDERRGRFVQIMYEDVSSKKEFLLAKILVTDAGDVVVDKDRREQVVAVFAREGVCPRAMPPRVSHNELVQRFVAAVTSLDPVPQWLLGCDTVNAQVRQGADLLLVIRFGRSHVELPVKIVASRAEKANYCRQLSSQDAARVFVMVAHATMSQEAMLVQLRQYVEAGFTNGRFKYMRRTQ